MTWTIERKKLQSWDTGIYPVRSKKKGKHATIECSGGHIKAFRCNARNFLGENSDFTLYLWIRVPECLVRTAGPSHDLRQFPEGKG